VRTTLDIDEDVLQAAKELAAAENKTAGRVLSDLARKGLTGPERGPGFDEDNQTRLEGGWYVLPHRGGGRVVTTELVNQLLEDADLEDAGLKRK
jgi:hypothetical protein